MNVVRFDTCLGLNNVLDPVGELYNAQTKVWEAPVLLNVDITPQSVQLRRGYSVVTAGAFHSLWSNGNVGYVVKDSTLYEVKESGVLRSIKADMVAGQRVSFVSAGGTIYWCNGSQKGKIVGGEAQEWGGGTYPHPNSVRTMSDPPIGHLLEYHYGRIYIAVENVVYFTEGAGLYDFVCMADGHLPFYDSDIRMLRSMPDGLYVGTDHGVEFCSGPDPNKFTYTKVSFKPPVSGTDIIVDGKFVDPGMNGPVAMWTDSSGVVVGGHGGEVTNLTRKKVRLPASSRGVGLLYDNKYVALLAP